MKIEIANVSQVDGVWPLVGPGFHAAAQRFGDDLAAGELWQMCRSGNAFLLIAHEQDEIQMSAIFRFERWGNGSVLRVLTLAGKNIRSWADEVKDHLAKLAKDNGASRIVAEGRDGWSFIFDEPKRLRSTYVMEIA